MIVPMAPLAKSTVPGQMGGGLDLDALAALGLAGNQPLGERDAGGTADACDRTQQIDQRRQVIRSHVEHRPAAQFVIEFWIRVPALVAVAGHEGGGRDRLADPAIVDQFAAGLDPAAEEGIGGAADKHAPGLGRGQRAGAVFAVDGQWFFAVDVLAGFDGGQVDLGVGLGHGQVEHDLDLGIGQQFLNGVEPGDAELFGLGLGAPHIQVRAGGDLHDFIGFAVDKIVAADIAAADDADFDFVIQGGSPFPDGFGLL